MPSAPNQAPLALVTGGARRLGAKLVEALVGWGWDVVIGVHQSREEAETLVSRLQGRQSLFVASADLSDPHGAQRLWDQLPRTPNLMIHGASIWTKDSWKDATMHDWEASRRLHVWPFLESARRLFGASTDGQTRHLIAVADARMGAHDPTHFSYAWAKRELCDLAVALADELAPRVRVNVLAPGMVLPPDQEQTPVWMESVRRATPLQRSGRPDDVVGGLHYLISNSFVTGQVLWIDGGRHLRGKTP